jgi:integral membrane protein (TIGR01906 family)
MPTGITRLLQLIVALTLPVVLLLGNIQLLAHPRFVHYEYGKTGFPVDTAIPPGGYRLAKGERTALAEAALRSIIGPEGMRLLEEARFQETGAPAFNTREIRHMRDVRWLFQQARLVFWIALILLVSSAAVLLWRAGPGSRTVAPALFISAGATLALAGVAGVYLLFNFNSFFTQFHHLFFEGSTWLFRRDDTLIRLFPTDFWFDAAAFIAGLTIIELLIVATLSWWWRGRTT